MLSRFQAFFSRVVELVETRPVPFRQYYYLFFAILAVRLALEFFSSHRLFTLDDILHISLWFTFIVLVFLSLLQIFSGEKMERVAKLVITFFTIALTAPIIDLIISGGSGLKMNYLALNNAGDVLWAYITIGGSSMVRGATPGIRIEIVLLVLAAFNYVRTKRQSFVMGLVAAIVIYTALFFSGAIPLFLSLMVDFLQLKYAEDDQSTLLLLLCANAALLFFCLFRHAPSRIIWLLFELPWLQISLWAIAALIGIRLGHTLYPQNWSLNPTTVFQVLLLPAIAVCLGVVARPQNERSAAVNAALLLGLVLAAFISQRTFFTVAVAGSLAYLLYQQPLRLYRTPLLRRFMEGMLVLASALVGFTAMGAPMVGFPSQWILLMLWPAAVMALCRDFSDEPIYGVNWLSGQGPVVKWLLRIFIFAQFVGMLLLFANEIYLSGGTFLFFGGIVVLQIILVSTRRPPPFLSALASLIFYTLLLIAQ